MFYVYRQEYRPFAVMLALPSFVTAITFLIRHPLRRQSRGFFASAVAYVSGYAMPVFLPLYFWLAPPAHTSNPNILTLGSTLWIIGMLFSAIVTWHLRHAFSIVPQARTLVTTGPYSYARHPLYGCYLLRDAGGVLLTQSPVFLAGYVAWFLIMLVRIRYEESVLTQTFPEYADYRKRVWMFSPAWIKPRQRSAAAGMN